ncbi:homoserine O-succinyltransferase [Pullulanibacillus pueri]|uniref:Homoserine O-acetyltransferase n=1 Tax=Pullulanibacillus pueri TaxID=1437324 RepID=A0A8J2ZV09_9BACL|nr:homoserine O-succinyltransferase [Pullulanibacillus pueri]MBM7681411.1 homoserine O-succinyltransferase [Pullulanibacillus pueri]GGH78770.1 homoserine O-succinyltransferase [Pullulanibacillus pueri]
MPINVPKLLPARNILEKENIFLMDDERAVSQDIRPLNIVILNLMPQKEKTETQLLRLLGNTALQVNVTLLYTSSYESKHVSRSHLEQFYSTYNRIKHRRYDGMIITGAPIEHFPFEKVHYWPELTEIMEWSKTHVTSTLHICWGAQAALYYHYGINKYELPEKIAGIFSHGVSDPTVKLVQGFDEEFLAPHSRNTDVSQEEIEADERLDLLSVSPEAGAFIIMSKDQKNIMVTGHLEYDSYTLQEEYLRDQKNGLNPKLPKHYFPEDNPDLKPVNRWRSHAHLLFSNWLNYYVYQQTPYLWD